jgi:hypothetical protein
MHDGKIRVGIAREMVEEFIRESAARLAPIAAPAV